MGSQILAGLTGGLRRNLPVGRTLPDAVWRSRHTGIVYLLWVHAGVVPVFALIRGFSLIHALLESAILPATALLAASTRFTRRQRTAVASAGVLSSSAILVHLSGGVIEMHFHFFVMVAVVALYQDWVPFLAAVGYVFAHHGIAGAIDPTSVYNHPQGQADPWTWAGIHALFITGISIACLVTWRLNESILAEREHAEERLREETRMVETLHRVGQTLAAELDTENVVQAVTDAAVEVTNAAFGAFFYNVVSSDGEAYQLFSLSGAPRAAFEGLGLPRNTPVFAPTFGGEHVVRLDDVTQDPRYGRLPPHHGMPPGHLPVRSYLAVPVRSRNAEVIGGLFFGHPEPARFTEIDERIVVGIASQAAIAIDNARLYESEREAHASSEAARGRLAVLADASRVLTSSLEVDALLRALAALVTGSVGDCCLIDLVDDEGEIRRIADTSSDRTSETVQQRPPARQDQTHPVRLVVREAQARVVPGQDVAGAAAPEGSVAVVVPLSGRRAVLGAMSLVSADGGLSEADLPFAEELGRRAAIAVENARLYARQRTVAETLQHSLLPDRLPDIPGLAAAAQYVAGGPDVEVGGDWYDVVQLPGGRLGLVIGDVVGRGERAAALMGQLRSALRAYCRDHYSPADVLGRLNDLLLAAGPEHMATAVYIVLDPETGSLEYVNAGHPPPLLAAGREAAYLDAARGVPLGAMAGARFTPATAMLPGGGTLVLYTDGLVEDRLSPLDEGMERLRRAVISAPEGLDELCSHVMATALRGRNSHDDAAVLAVRLLALGPKLTLRLPARPSVLAPLRATMRRWLVEAGADEQERDELLIAAGELCANAIRHASGPVRGEFEIEAEVDGVVTIVVRDNGRWRAARAGVGGRGLAIVREYVDDVDIDPGPDGTEVRVRRALAHARRPVART